MDKKHFVSLTEQLLIANMENHCRSDELSVLLTRTFVVRILNRYVYRIDVLKGFVAQFPADAVSPVCFST